MAMRTEFQLASLMESEVKKYLVKKGFTLRSEVLRQGNGRLAFVYRWATLPAYLNEAPTFPEDWLTRYFYHEEAFDLTIQQGRYTFGEGVNAISLTVQKFFNIKANSLCYEINADGSDLKLITDACEQLRAGALKPVVSWSSPGTIEAPKAEEPASKGEGSGSHPLPQTAATASAA